MPPKRHSSRSTTTKARFEPDHLDVASPKVSSPKAPSPKVASRKVASPKPNNMANMNGDFADNSITVLDTHPANMIDTSILMPRSSPTPNAAPRPRTGALSYENANLEEITFRQLHEDVSAYKHDLDFCQDQLENHDLTPQEMRTLQLRTLDLGHQIRSCTNRIETLHVQMRIPASSHHTYQAQAQANISPAYSAQPGALMQRQPKTGNFSTGTKRPAPDDAEDPEGGPSLSKRAKTDADDLADTDEAEDMGGDESLANFVPGARTLALQRLGFWKCHLCTSPKYLLAGVGRVPAAPCKWPLKDVSKMITHFTEMHVEHTVAERCKELGEALWANIGPLEYWVRRTRQQKLEGSVIRDAVEELKAGTMPELLRRLSRAASSMPES